MHGDSTSNEIFERDVISWSDRTTVEYFFDSYKTEMFLNVNGSERMNDRIKRMKYEYRFIDYSTEVICSSKCSHLHARS